MKGRRYTTDERRIVERMCARHCSTQEIAAVIRRDVSSVRAYLKNHGLQTGRDTRFKNGHKPWNNGTRGAGICKPNAGSFKKGDLPVNTLYDGAQTIRIDTATKRPYWWIRHSVGKWEHLHRHLWRQERGEIPKDMMVVFKDGNTLNCTIDNLQLLSKAENARRNSGSINLPDGYVAALLSVRNPELRTELMKRPDLLELKRQSIQLNREINGTERRDKN